MASQVFSQLVSITLPQKALLDYFSNLNRQSISEIGREALNDWFLKKGVPTEQLPTTHVESLAANNKRKRMGSPDLPAAPVLNFNQPLDAFLSSLDSVLQVDKPTYSPPPIQHSAPPPVPVAIPDRQFWIVDNGATKPILESPLRQLIQSGWRGQVCMQGAAAWGEIEDYFPTLVGDTGNDQPDTGMGSNSNNSLSS